MKSYFLLFFIILISISSCKKATLNDNKQSKDIFNPVLKKEILKMIEIKRNNKDVRSKICNVVILQDANRDAACSVIISLNNSIPKETTTFIPFSDSLHIQTNPIIEIIGYTFIENELIFCYLFSDFCNDNLVNKNGLIPYNDNDSIPGYPDIAKDYFDRTSESPICIYKIIDDSLQLIKSEWIDINSGTRLKNMIYPKR
jgi:hypothetical protein